MAETTATLKECKPGAYIMVDGEPCKVMDFAKFKTGKHGSAKARLTVMGIFDGKKRDVHLPADTQVQVPIIVRLEGTNVEQGREILANSGLKFTVATDMRDAAQKVAALVG